MLGGRPDDDDMSDEPTPPVPSASLAVRPVSSRHPSAPRQYHSILHGTSSFQLSRQRTEQLHAEHTKLLIEQRRLVLVLDLDNTLVHATTEAELRHASSVLKTDVDTLKGSAQDGDLREVALRGDESNRFVVKFRPGLREFLDAMTSHFELHMYTMGTRAYATTIAREIDPERRYFCDRLLCRDDCDNSTEKRLERLFPHGDSMVLVVDDRGDVWRRNPDNLVYIFPYHYFPYTRPVNPLPGDSQLKTPTNARALRDRAQQDAHLVDVSRSLLTLHRRWFDLFDADALRRDDSVPNAASLVRKLRRSVFSKCTLVFSGVFPRERTNTQNIRMLRLARQYGAVVSTVLGDSTTHVIGARAVTEKIELARRQRNVFVVSVQWFHDSIRALRRLDEQDYPLDDNARVYYKSRPTIDRPSIDDMSSSSDEDAGDVEEDVENNDANPREQEDQVHRDSRSDSGAVSSNEHRQSAVRNARQLNDAGVDALDGDGHTSSGNNERYGSSSDTWTSDQRLETDFDEFSSGYDEYKTSDAVYEDNGNVDYDDYDDDGQYNDDDCW